MKWREQLNGDCPKRDAAKAADLKNMAQLRALRLAKEAADRDAKLVASKPKKPTKRQ